MCLFFCVQGISWDLEFSLGKLTGLFSWEGEKEFCLLSFNSALPALEKLFSNTWFTLIKSVQLLRGPANLRKYIGEVYPNRQNLRHCR